MRGFARLTAAMAFSVAALVTVAPAGLVLENGFEGGAADWGASGVWSPTPLAPGSSSTVTTTKREGTSSVKFIRAADTPTASADTTQIRSEFVFRPSNFNNLTITHGTETWDGIYNWGTEYWVGFSVRVVTPVGGNGSIFQHHSTPHTDTVASAGHPVTGSPHWEAPNQSGENSFTIRTVGNTFRLHTATVAANVNSTEQSGSAYWGTEYVEVNYTSGVWYDFVLHFKLATNSTGYIQVWMKPSTSSSWGSPLIDKTGPTVYMYDKMDLPKTPKNTQKIGVYYGPNNSGVAGEVYYDSFRVWKGSGGSIAVVAPAGGGGGTTPGTPTSLTATRDTVNPTSQINLAWSNVANETGYNVERKTGAGGTYAEIAQPATNVTTLQNTGLTDGTQYYYRVRAHNGAIFSGYSPEANASTAAGGTPIVIDANTLPFTTSTTANPATDVITISGATGGNFLRFNGKAVNESITFTVNVAAGTYTIGGNFRKTPYSGKFQLLIDNSPQGSVFDGWASSGAFALGSFGTKTLSAGDHTFKFLVTGQNTSSTDFQVGVDTITLTP